MDYFIEILYLISAASSTTIKIDTVIELNVNLDPPSVRGQTSNENNNDYDIQKDGRNNNVTISKIFEEYLISSEETQKPVMRAGSYEYVQGTEKDIIQVSRTFKKHKKNKLTTLTTNKNQYEIATTPKALENKIAKRDSQKRIGSHQKHQKPVLRNEKHTQHKTEEVRLHSNNTHQFLYNKTHYSYINPLRGEYDINNLWSKQQNVKLFNDQFIPSSVAIPRGRRGHKRHNHVYYTQTKPNLRLGKASQKYLRHKVPQNLNKYRSRYNKSVPAKTGQKTIGKMIVDFIKSVGRSIMKPHQSPKSSHVRMPNINVVNSSQWAEYLKNKSIMMTASEEPTIITEPSIDSDVTVATDIPLDPELISVTEPAVDSELVSLTEPPLPPTLEAEPETVSEEPVDIEIVSVTEIILDPEEISVTEPELVTVIPETPEPELISHIDFINNVTQDSVGDLANAIEQQVQADVENIKEQVQEEVQEIINPIKEEVDNTVNEAVSVADEVVAAAKRSNATANLWRSSARHVKDDIHVNDFIKDIPKRYSKVFRVIEKKSTDHNWKKLLRKMKRLYEAKFNEFYEATRGHKIKSRSGGDRVVINSIIVSNRILRRLFNYVLGDMHNKRYFRNNDTIGTIDKEIHREVTKERQRACLQLAICRSSRGFATFVSDILTIMLSLENAKYITAFGNVAKAVKNTKLTDLFGADVAREIQLKVKIYDEAHVIFKRSAVAVLKNVVANRNAPLTLESGSGDVNKTIALIEVVNKLDEEVPDSPENLQQWNDIKSNFLKYQNGEESDIETTMAVFITHIIEVIGQLNEVSLAHVVRNTGIIFS